MNNYQDDRMKDLVGSLPQNRNKKWDNVIPVIDFEFSQIADPVKARRKNIKKALKVLKPVKRFTGLFGYKYNSEPHQCVVTGADCRGLDYGDLFDKYFRNSITKELVHFSPWTGVLPGKGRQMTGTYSPQALQLYKLLLDWMEQEEREHERGFFRQMKKKGVSFIPIKKAPKIPQHPLLGKWEEAFMEAQKDGIPIMRYYDDTGSNHLTMLVFDMGLLSRTYGGGTILGAPTTLQDLQDQEAQEKEIEA